VLYDPPMRTCASILLIAVAAGASSADRIAVSPACLDDKAVAAKLGALTDTNAKRYADALKEQKLVPANLVRRTWPLGADELTPFDKVETKAIDGRKVRLLLAGTVRLCNPIEPRFVRRGSKVYRVQLKLKPHPGYATTLDVCGCEPTGPKCDSTNTVDVGLGFELPRNLRFGGVLEVETVQENYALYYGIAPASPCGTANKAR